MFYQETLLVAEVQLGGGQTVCGLYIGQVVAS